MSEQTDQFDLFEELIANQPAKCSDWQVAYWAAMHAVRNAAHRARRCYVAGSYE
jgi:hypothetical protein